MDSNEINSGTSSDNLENNSNGPICNNDEQMQESEEALPNTISTETIDENTNSRSRNSSSSTSIIDTEPPSNNGTPTFESNINQNENNDSDRQQQQEHNQEQQQQQQQHHHHNQQTNPQQTIVHVRDRLFHALFYRLAIMYARKVKLYQLIELKQKNSKQQYI